MVDPTPPIRTIAPARGDIVWLEFDPQAGHEQAGTRPALVLSPVEYQRKAGLMLCCPITNQVKGYPFEVALDAKSDARGVVLADQVKSVDWQARKARRKGRVSPAVLSAVSARIKALLPG
jgi:mRNA interferase MazF